MSLIVREIAGLCYHLDKLYNGERDKKRKKEIGKNFEIMSGILDRAIRSQFDENDKEYKKNVRRLKKNIREIKRQSGLLDKYEKLMEGLAGIGKEMGGLLGDTPR